MDYNSNSRSSIYFKILNFTRMPQISSFANHEGWSEKIFLHLVTFYCVNGVYQPMFSEVIFLVQFSAGFLFPCHVVGHTYRTISTLRNIQPYVPSDFGFRTLRDSFVFRPQSLFAFPQIVPWLVRNFTPFFELCQVSSLEWATDHPLVLFFG